MNWYFWKKKDLKLTAISEARSHGDLKATEYHAAKEEQSHNEGRLQINIIARANIIDITN